MNVDKLFFVFAWVKCSEIIFGSYMPYIGWKRKKRIKKEMHGNFALWENNSFICDELELYLYVI